MGILTNTNKPEDTFTLEDLISFKSTDNMTYYNLSILSKSIEDNGLIYSKDNVIYTYLGELKARSKLVKLTDDEYQTYRFKPKLLSYYLYGHTELYFMIMAVNNICDIKDFDMKKLYALSNADMNYMLKQIYSAEVDYINYNRKEIGEKNNVI